MTIKSRKGEVQVTVDEEFSRVNVDKVPTLRPPFKKDGAWPPLRSCCVQWNTMW